MRLGWECEHCSRAAHRMVGGRAAREQGSHIVHCPAVTAFSPSVRPRVGGFGAVGAAAERSRHEPRGEKVNCLAAAAFSPPSNRLVVVVVVVVVTSFPPDPSHSSDGDGGGDSDDVDESGCRVARSIYIDVQSWCF